MTRLYLQLIKDGYSKEETEKAIKDLKEACDTDGRMLRWRKRQIPHKDIVEYRNDILAVVKEKAPILEPYV